MKTVDREERRPGLGQALFYLGLAAVVTGLGLGLRLVPVGLPFWLVKWGGSVLWAAMVYLLIASLLVRSGRFTVAMVAGGIAGVVELSRLVHSPALDAFRLSTAGALLLGRVFQWGHFVAYWAAIGLMAAADRKFLRRVRPTPRMGLL